MSQTPSGPLTGAIESVNKRQERQRAPRERSRTFTEAVSGRQESQILQIPEEVFGEAQGREAFAVAAQLSESVAASVQKQRFEEVVRDQLPQGMRREGFIETLRNDLSTTFSEDQGIHPTRVEEILQKHFDPVVDAHVYHFEPLLFRQEDEEFDVAPPRLPEERGFLDPEAAERHSKVVSEAESIGFIRQFIQDRIPEFLPSTLAHRIETTGDDAALARDALVDSSKSLARGFHGSAERLQRSVLLLMQMGTEKAGIDHLAPGLVDQIDYEIELSRQFEDLARDFLEVRPEFQDGTPGFFVDDLPEIAGSLAIYLAVGKAGAAIRGAAAARGGGAGAVVASGTIGALDRAAIEYDRALDEGVGLEEAQSRFIKNLPVGFTEAIPVSIGLRALQRPAGERLGGIVQSAIANAAQGGGAEVLSNMIAGREPFDNVPSHTIASGLAGGSLVGVGQALAAGGERAMARRAVRELEKRGIITPEERRTLQRFQRKDLIGELAGARLSNKKARLAVVPKKDQDGNIVGQRVFVSGKNKTDIVTFEEKRALNFNNDLIQRLRRKKRRSSARRASTLGKLLFEDRRNLQGSDSSLPRSTDKGYFAEPENLADSPSVINRIRREQQQVLDEVEAISQNDVLTDRQKRLALRELDQEFEGKVDKLLDRDTPETGVRISVDNALKKREVNIERREEIRSKIEDPLRMILDNEPHASQRRILDKILEGELDPEVRDIIQSVKKDYAENWRTRSTYDKLEHGLSVLQRSLDRVDPKTWKKKGKDLRREAGEVVGEMFRGTEVKTRLVKRLSKIKTARQFEGFVREAHKEAIKKQKQIMDENIVGMISRKSGTGGRVKGALRPQRLTVEDRSELVKLLREMNKPASRGLPSSKKRRVLNKTPKVEGDEFRAISEHHRALDDRWNELVNQGVLTRDQHLALRYITSRTDIGLIRHLQDVRAEPIDSVATYLPREREIVFSRRTGLDADNADTFLHELGHLAFIEYLTVDERNAFRSWYYRMRSEESRYASSGLPEFTKLHDLISDINRLDPFESTNRSDINYFASDPEEAFAELFSVWLLHRTGALNISKNLEKDIGFPHLDAILESTVRRVKDSDPLRDGLRSGAFSTDVRNILDETVVAKPRSDVPGLSRSGDKTIRMDFPEDIETRPQVGARSRQVVTGTEKGRPRINIRALRENLKSLSYNQTRELFEQMNNLARRSQLRKKVIIRGREAEISERTREIVQDIDRLPSRRDLFQDHDAVLQALRLTGDPVTVEGYLFQLSRGDENSPIYQQFFKNFEDAYSRHYQDTARIRKDIAKTTEEIYGIKDNSLKFINYLRKKVSGNARRTHAMSAYALSRDPGRSEDLFRHGVKVGTKVHKAQTLIDTLTDKDRAFVERVMDILNDQSQGGIQDNLLRTYLAIEGYHPEMSPRYHPSRREELKREVRLVDDVHEAGAEAIQDASFLKHRRDIGDQKESPFVLRRMGFLEEVISTADRQSLYGRVGIEGYNALKVLRSPEVRNSLVAKIGQSRYDMLQEYIRNILGLSSGERTFFDKFSIYVARGFLGGRLTGNVASAIRQSFSIGTTMGDNVIDKGALMKALSEEMVKPHQMFSGRKSVIQRMMDNSGFAAIRLRYKFLENFAGVGDVTGIGRLTFLQERAFFLQRAVDRAALTPIYRAAEIMAEKRGLKGKEFDDFVRNTFEKATMRIQGTNSPLYMSELEIMSRTRPWIRLTIVLQRELNRLYNVPRRHLVNAINNPSPQNWTKAGNAIFWSLVANTIMDVGLTEARERLFGRPARDAKERSRRMLQSVAGRWFIAGDVFGYFTMFGEHDERWTKERLINAPTVTAMWAVRGATNLVEGARKGLLTGDEDELDLIESGPYKGEPRWERQILRGLDDLFGATSNITGLPFWAIWYQGRGLYNWNRPDLIKMARLEAERAQLTEQEQEDTHRFREIQHMKNRINEVHNLRRRRVIDREEAQRRVLEILDQDPGPRR